MMQNVVSVSPFRCRMWEYHDRLEEGITAESCKAEIASFLAHGQQLPVLGRPLKGEHEYDIELVYGARRLFIARHLNIPLQVELREISDREAVIALDAENRHRKELSPYERGLSYMQWLRSQLFESQEQLANVLKVSPSQVSRLLKLAKLPSIIVQAFGSPSELREVWALDLYDAWQDKEKRRRIADRARALVSCQPRMPATKVYETLLAEGSIRARGSSDHDEVVKDDQGTPLFRISNRRETTALLIPKQGVSDQMLRKIKAAVADILTQPPAPKRRFEPVRVVSRPAIVQSEKRPYVAAQ